MYYDNDVKQYTQKNFFRKKNEINLFRHTETETLNHPVWPNVNYIIFLVLFQRIYYYAENDCQEKIKKLRYTDDITFMAESEEELKSLLMNVKEES